MVIYHPDIYHHLHTNFYQFIKLVDKKLDIRFILMYYKDMKERNKRTSPNAVYAQVGNNYRWLNCRSHVDALTTFNTYVRSFSKLKPVCKVSLYFDWYLYKTFTKEEGINIMGNLANVRAEYAELNPFMSLANRTRLVNEKIAFNVVDIKQSVSKITGKTQHIVSMEIIDEAIANTFEASTVAMSFDDDKSRAGMFKYMNEEISKNKFYGPCILTMSGRYYVIDDKED